MNEIVEDNVLEAIHYILEYNGFKFSDEKKSLADTYITPSIGDLNINPKEFNVVTMGAPKLFADKRIVPLVIEYFAFIQNNKDLYKALNKEAYVFYEKHSIKFYALDRVLTGNFNVDEYKNLLLEYEGVVSRFYSSLRGLSKEEKEKCCKEFSEIIRSDSTTLDVGCGEVDDSNNYNFLISRNIILFGKEFLLRLNKEQRGVINNIRINLTEEEAAKIKELYTRYPDCSSDISLSRELLSYFSVEEISNMSRKDSILYEEALNVGLHSRMKSILSLDPDFSCPMDFIRADIFKTFTDEEIIGLTGEAKEEILNTNIPEGEDVPPIKIYKKILSRDEKRKKTKDNKDSIKK